MFRPVRLRRYEPNPIAGFTAPQACNATFFAGMGSIVKRLTGPSFLQGQAL